MAKGDDARSRNRIEYSGDRGRDLSESLRTGVLNPNVAMFRNNYQDATNRQLGDYGNIMSGYQDFAQTGGFTPEGLAAIRARAISPTRAVYANMQRGLSRQRALQGGYSPGFATASARLAREGSQMASDASTNAEAAIAQLVQQGRLSGLSGAGSMYSATPGLVSTFGNQVLGASGQLSDAIQNEMGFGNDLARLQIAASQIPGKWENTVGRIGDVFDIGKNVVGAFSDVN